MANPYLSKVAFLGLLLGLFEARLAVLPRFKGGLHSFVVLSMTWPSGHGFFALVLLFALMLLFAFLPRFRGGLHSFVVLSMTWPSGHGFAIFCNYVYTYLHIIYIILFTRFVIVWLSMPQHRVPR
jgi:hypothetical protein